MTDHPSPFHVSATRQESARESPTPPASAAEGRQRVGRPSPPCVTAYDTASRRRPRPHRRAGRVVSDAPRSRRQSRFPLARAFTEPRPWHGPGFFSPQWKSPRSLRGDAAGVSSSYHPGPHPHDRPERNGSHGGVFDVRPPARQRLSRRSSRTFRRSCSCGGCFGWWEAGSRVLKAYDLTAWVRSGPDRRSG